MNTRVYAVKANYNRLLDVARETYRENIEDIYKLNTSMAEEHSLPLTLVYKETGCGFWFTVRRDEVTGQLPKDFLNVTATGAKMVFTSLELVGITRSYPVFLTKLITSPQKKRNARFKDSLDEALILSDKWDSCFSEQS